MHVLEVGKLYSPKRTSWPECAQYNFRGGGHELVVFFDEPTSDEVSSFRTGTTEFGLVVRGAVIILLYRFGAHPWSDAPYSFHLLAASKAYSFQAVLPDPDASPETRALLQMILVDGRTGIIRAMRQVTWSPEFTRVTHDAIRAQAAMPWNPRAYDAELEALMGRFDSDALLLAAAVRTQGGA